MAKKLTRSDIEFYIDNISTYMESSRKLNNVREELWLAMEDCLELTNSQDNYTNIKAYESLDLIKNRIELAIKRCENYLLNIER